MQLNPSQRAVVATRARRLLVLAGAGTGKTATSVHWVAEVLRGGVPREQVLMITFTRKAAKEMAERVERLARDIPRKGDRDAITVGTYHAVASILLRQDAEAFGLRGRNFTTLDEGEAHSVWKSALKQSGHDAKSGLHMPSKLHSIYSLARNTCVSPAELFARQFGEDAVGELRRIVRHYEELKLAANVVDYDDLLVLWARRLENDAKYAHCLRERFRFVLVDEMQDNNQLNQRILDGLDPEHLLVVGDANQSIYGFRGSDVSLILDFPRKHADAQILKLEDNYRSGQEILDLANTIVTNGDRSLNLRAAKREVKAAVEYREYLSQQTEADGCVRWMLNRVSSGRRGCDSTVLARSSKALLPLEIALRFHKIPYRKYGGQTIADAAEVKDFVAFLRVAHNSHDKIALLRTLTQFPGIGEGTAAKVIAAREDGGLFTEEIWPKAASKLPIWIRTLREPRSLGAKGRYLADVMKEMIEHNYPGDAEERMATIEALVASMQTSESSMDDFLDGFALDRQTDHYHPNDAVTLSTIHSAKGLEWDGVWILGAGSQQIPHPRATEDAQSIEEERRLFYVAVTRAKQHLVLSYPQMLEKKGSQNRTPFAPATSYWMFCRD